MVDYFTDGMNPRVAGPRHGQRIPDPNTMHDWVYDENIQDWIKESAEVRLEKSAYPVSSVYVPGLSPMKSKAVSGHMEAKFYPEPGIDLPLPLPEEPEVPQELPITDFDFNEEDFEI